MRPFSILRGLHVLIMAYVKVASCFADIRFFAVGTVIFIYAFALERVWLSFVFGTECRLEFLAGFYKSVATSPLESTFEFVGDASWDERDGGVGAQLNAVVGAVVVVVIVVAARAVGFVVADVRIVEREN